MANTKLSAKRGLKMDTHIRRLLIIMVCWFIFMGIMKGRKFYSVVNFQTMFAQFPEFGLMSLGVMVCMISSGIDLSTVGVANMTSITMALLMRRIANGGSDLSPAWVLPIFTLALLIGAAAGLLNGVLIAKLKIPPILATLGTGELFSGIGIVLTGGSAISDFPATYAYLINNRIAGIPVQFLIFAAGAAILWFLLGRTTYGKKLTLLGSSEKMLRASSGLNVDWILVKTYLISGIYAAAGGMIMLANYNSARADYGSNYTLQCILIVVLGGVSPNGGKGQDRRRSAFDFPGTRAGNRLEPVPADQQLLYLPRLGCSSAAGHGSGLSERA